MRPPEEKIHESYRRKKTACMISESRPNASKWQNASAVFATLLQKPGTARVLYEPRDVAAEFAGRDSGGASSAPCACSIHEFSRSNRRPHVSTSGLRWQPTARTRQAHHWFG